MFQAAFIRITNKFVLLGTAVVWLSLLAGLLGRLAWPFDLFAHFRVQYAVSFVLLAAVAAMLRRYGLALAAAFGFVISSVALFPYVSTEPVATAAATPNGATFRLLSFNVWFRNPDMARVAEYIEQSQADAVVLLELTPPQAETLLPLLPSYPHYHIEPSRMGAAVFTKWPMLSAESVPLSHSGAIAARMTVDWRGTPVNVLGVHLNWPLGPRNSEFRNQELSELVEFSKAQQGPLIVAGDFNLTPWSEYFAAALERSGLHDAAVGFGLARSWPAQFAPVGMRIDHCWLSPQWRSLSAAIGPSLGSDHLPLVADLSLQP
ncbi:endonuclease/exonuclease/phosphatase family protein [Steroidobacter sp.]|uniref:endonuclease/exonuclease/phosphatase family protein n=1 Tax=Steroidobacter sp. TaxID=1978227 RepID=UPI001A41E88D|nr:endonuclease/exonuclease/phosphatase family protein [Steroidobacter sp.]MBL8269986.1 endonuclease/exonuclease/phosphatase family protein [Steroidobacter sp.]